MTGAAKPSGIILLRVAAGVSLLAFLGYYTPPADPAFRLCGFHWLTGRLCPLCGLTRAMFALAKGQLSEAVSFNALSPLAFAMLAGLFWNGPMRGRVWSWGTAAFAIYGVCRILLPMA
ncbi:MAG TPA: DUF2752 domain-containing protein [Bryobacteraceae bacterium]|nr:DUF2752 domain-containing protein [Bryobacteraceae bacterium]HXJ41473.1 DUF2752 domain-containing protein [Bryobacteraceae bacterium]